MTLPQKFPKLLIERIHQFFGDATATQILEGWQRERCGSFRINTIKTTPSSVIEILKALDIEALPSPWLPLAYTFKRSDEYRLKGSKLFREGLIYLQGISSQIPVEVMGDLHGKTILDVTAAPGSKTLQMSALSENTATVVAYEKHQIRFDTMLFNIRLQGGQNIITHKKDFLTFAPTIKKETFDIILLDAPCSAEGRIDMKNEKTFGFWTLENIQNKATIQDALMNAAIPLLKKGGLLVYSTCTLAPEENECVIQNILSRHPDLEVEPIHMNIPNALDGLEKMNNEIFLPDMKKTRRILPNAEMEGFFIAKLRKNQK